MQESGGHTFHACMKRMSFLTLKMPESGRFSLKNDRFPGISELWKCVSNHNIHQGGKYENV
jgi:hypothetical protein